LLPQEVSFDQGAAINTPYATAYRALYIRGKGKNSGNNKLKVLIHGGSGGVGIAAIQFAVHDGMEVYATAGSSEVLPNISFFLFFSFFFQKKSPFIVLIYKIFERGLT
jgi:NADPH:quinone reductase-like Zn-dependent oxidoreductase